MNEIERKYISTKTFQGFSTCFRQWRATKTHCQFLHGYAVKFKITFQGGLDVNNWVWDFGGMKRATTKIEGKSPEDYFKWLLDHTVIVADDDPKLMEFQELDKQGIIQLRVLADVGCEMFAEYLIDKVNDFLEIETQGRVTAIKLEFFENETNSAIAYREGSYAKIS